MTSPNAVPNFNAMMREANRSPAPSSSSSPRGEPGSSGAEPSRLFVTAILIVALISALVAIAARWEPNKWLHRDGAFYMNIARGLIENHSLSQETLHPHSWFEDSLGWNHNVDAAWSNIALGRNGEWWPKHPILMPLCAAPFIWAFGPIGSLVFQLLSFLCVALFTYRIAAFFAPRPCALAAAAIFVTMPWVGRFVWGFNNDMFFTALLLGALDAGLRRKAIGCGLLLGLAIFAKPTNVLYAPPLLAIFLLRRDFRLALKMCLAAAVPCLAMAGLHTYLYGAPWKTGYDNILVRVAGKLTTHSHRADFAFTWKGLMDGLDNVLFGDRHGLWTHFPIFFAALAGMIPMFGRRTREGFAFLWLLIVPIAFHASFTWYRLDFSLPQMALSAAPLALLLSPKGQPFEEPFQERQIRWGPLLSLILVVVLGTSGLVRRLLTDERDVLWTNIGTAHVTHGKARCDYFNNQLERWECSGIKGDAEMTGRALRGLRFNQKKHKLLLVAPASDGASKRIEFPKLELGNKFLLRYGIPDDSKGNSSVHLKMRIGNETVLSQEVTKKDLLEKIIDTSRWQGKATNLSFTIETSKRARADRLLFGIGGEVLDK
jgi:hypothetical protein